MSNLLTDLLTISPKQGLQKITLLMFIRVSAPLIMAFHWSLVGKFSSCLTPHDTHVGVSELGSDGEPPAAPWSCASGACVTILPALGLVR